MYRTNFIIAKEHGISLSELDEMVPFERKIYISLIFDYLDKKARQQAKR
jgi:hypothetical protein